ncbi:MAG: ferrous iron transport protein B [Coriobacteriia bacterium]|nr:ferrous iron transport protein B [Coriobacteriia bacterium]
MKLDAAQIGSSYKVTKVNGKTKDRQHLLDMGLIPGTHLKVIKRAPLGDPMEIRLHAYELALRNSNAAHVIVEEAEDLYNLTCSKNCAECKKAQETEHPGLGEPGRFHNKKHEHPLPSDKTLKFALVGNQNSGKTTLFNALTGSNQHVGNFPGVTVERKDGSFKNNKNTQITDLPGIYSLSPYSKEELVSRQFILEDDCDCIINIIDATSIERSLYLTMQLLQLEHPMVVALNMMDELESNEGSILLNALEQELGVPIVPISALSRQGIDELVDHAMHIAKYQELPLRQDFCDRGSVHRALHSIMHIIEDHCAQSSINNHEHLIPIRFAAEKIAENDQAIIDKLNLNEQDKAAIEHILIHMEEECKLDRAALIADMRYNFILRVTSNCVIKGKPSSQRRRSEAADKFLTGKLTGIPAFIAIMAAVFWLTFDVIGGNIQKLIALGIDSLSNVVEAHMISVGVSETVQSLVTDAIFKGVGTVVSFVPIIVVLFFFLSILEDSGYMARVAFVMDKLLRKIGLSGRSIVPLLIGFGCSVPAIMSTRTLPSERDRKLTIMLTPYMSCSAKLPVYVFLSFTFFPDCAALVMLLMYVLGIVVGIIVALFAKGKSRPIPFIMELPNYRMPSASNVLRLMWDKCKDFITRAFTIIFIATIIIWFLQSFDLTLNYTPDASNSILATIAGFITPVFAPIGLGDWRIVTSLITGFLAKESIIASLTVLFTGAAGLSAILTPLAGLSFMIFVLLYTPCIAAIAAVKRELGLRYALAVVVFQCVIAWIVSFIVFSVGNLILML